jgi:hypothetical protein
VTHPPANKKEGMSRLAKQDMNRIFKISNSHFLAFIAAHLIAFSISLYAFLGPLSTFFVQSGRISHVLLRLLSDFSRTYGIMVVDP